ncbi:hypothetical protein I8748_13905 [Nostoc sp. CENA67]|uniref:Uncharacterized protein n=1 Tax=Amazonocrinis nigriterrae CENA67 TaxID=2794033 RepID=A0A8J7HTK0_9NOST|nr:hypothetical protein [Amazonocrinis nigriterrae]MBH8563267.1 hypothetical protein [Amazonocrinis nigriterrae CENA67]
MMKTVISLLAKVDVKIYYTGAGVLVLLQVVLPVVVKLYAPQAAENAKQPEQSTQVQLRPFGRIGYEQLRIGMSLTDVRAILGPGVEISRSPTMATFVWENPDGSKITATFESDKLKSKAQSELK